MSALKTILWLLVTFISVALGAWIVVDNPDPVSFKIFGFTASTLPLGLWLLGSFSIGCITSLLVTSSTLIRLNYRLRRADRRYVKLKSSIADIKEEK
ncbi:MAG: putative integral membrane protein [Porticoccus sp.]